MFCRNCGNEVKDKSVICSACGYSTGDSGEMTASAGKRWSWFTMFVTIAVFIALLLIAIIAGL
jgi:uncharacterized membrane protein YvbJ